MKLDNLDLSLSLARRQKRLQYWQKTLLELSQKNKKVLSDSVIKKLDEDLRAYKGILSKLVSCTDQDEFSHLEKSLLTLETQFNNSFSYKRLLTSSSGVPAVEENA